jgi:crotonobetainyl-CoA:carnitine CoA-transferase CaiB-like acyl-CoA transferase
MCDAADLPLLGVRVLDLGIITAGAATTALLADLGADVIKIESPNYIDPFRVWTGAERKGDWWNQSAYFAFTNRNKKSISLDLKSHAGRALFLRLVEISDVLVENFRRGVMERLGLGIASLRAINPRLIAAAVSSQGETGADRMAVSFGSTLEATSGMAALTGFSDGPPILTGRDMNYPDQVVALFAASMIVSALLARKRTGHGAHLDISQRELTTYLLGEKFHPDASGREGNEDGCVFLQTVAPTVDGHWIALTIAAEADMQRLNQFGVADISSLHRWVAANPLSDIVDALRAADIPVAPVMDGAAICAADWFSESTSLMRDPCGRTMKGFPFQFRATPMTINQATPPFGHDTASVLMDLLGLHESEIATLARDGVIADRPTEAYG